MDMFIGDAKYGVIWVGLYRGRDDLEVAVMVTRYTEDLQKAIVLFWVMRLVRGKACGWLWKANEHG